MFETKVIEYKDYGKCLCMTNGVIDVVVTTDFGPRIIRYGFIDGTNIMNDNRDLFSSTCDEKYEKYFGKGKYFNIYGGHRLWTSPEYYPEMYYPDNTPVAYEIIENGVVFTPDFQTENELQMKIKVTLDPDDTNIEVTHYATNASERVKEFSLWALTLSAKGGIEIIPMNTHDTKLLPNGKMVLWPYTDLRTDNIYLGHKYVTISQPETDRLKLGFELKKGVVYYVVNDVVFIKNYYPTYPTGVYPDGGVSFETYSCNRFTELETLSELKKVAPGETVTHTERWSLCKKPCDFDTHDDDSIDEFISKL